MHEKWKSITNIYPDLST